MCHKGLFYRLKRNAIKILSIKNDPGTYFIFIKNLIKRYKNVIGDSGYECEKNYLFYRSFDFFP